MRSDDVALIQRILDGDESAFANLVRKYEKRIHTLAWQKTRDFHIAEDIVQETFLQVYRKLETLEDPTQFSRWLYQIADRLCIAWFRKDRIRTEPLEETDTLRIETEAYSRYVASEHAKTTAEAQRDLVQKLLAKLRESDREVITLHYFEEMTSSEIGTFLGVSENTVKSRLHRARQRLKQYEFMIQEALDITIEEGHRSQKQLKGEINMTDEVRDNTEVETNEEKTQRQIADLQQQIKVIAAESDAFLASRTNDALETLRRVPYDVERPISWGYVGGYRTSPGNMTSRVAFWGDNIDNFLSKAPDADIVNLASLFTNANVIAVLRQLVEGKRSVSDLANGCGLPEGEIEKAVETLMDATLVARTEDNLIEPKNDAVSFFLNFVSMTIVHLGHIKPEN